MDKKGHLRYTCIMVQINKQCCSPKEAASVVSALDNLLLADLFHALSDPTRNKLLACLAKCARPCSVSEVGQCWSIDLSVVSRHLSILEAAGILTSEKTGRVVSYSVQSEVIAKLLRDLAKAFEDCSEGCAPVTKIKRRK